MSLSDTEAALLSAAGSTADASARRQAAGIVLSKTGSDRQQAEGLLGGSFLATTQPSFHLIPRGDAMASEPAFEVAYGFLAEATENFSAVDEARLVACLTEHPEALAPLRMILGLTLNELAVAMKLVDPDSTTGGSWLKTFERSPVPERPRPQRARAVNLIARTADAVMARTVLSVVPDVATSFHSKLDKRDTNDGWQSVAADAGGVPYWALLYQRYVGGVWRQVQDAYSEVKGDAVLEYPIAAVLTSARVPFWQTPRGANGAALTAQRYSLDPGPDFVIPDVSPTVIIESKVAEDGGTARDKAARIKNLAVTARSRGLVACAVVDGKGWRERPGALVDVVLATEGRTYTLSTLSHILSIPEVASLVGTAPEQLAPLPESNEADT